MDETTRVVSRRTHGAGKAIGEDEDKVQEKTGYVGLGAAVSHRANGMAKNQLFGWAAIDVRLHLQRAAEFARHGQCNH